MVLICGTKFVPVTLVYHGYRYRAPISVIVNYLNDTTVTPSEEMCVFITAGPIIKLCAGGEGDSEGHVL
jgi:hypothetical protein